MLKSKFKIFFVLTISVLLFACNAAKSLAKKGDKLAEAGIHKEAVEFYIKALNVDRSRVNAQVGLRKSAENVMSKYQSKFFNEYASGEYKNAVYTFLEMKSFKKRLDIYNAEVNFPKHLNEDFEDAKKKYLKVEFEKANQLLAEEKFESAEAIFVEIQKVEPNYKGSDLEKLKEIAQLEPHYRQGNDYLEQGKNRAAYYEFEMVTNLNSNYKDAQFKQEEALKLAEYPIAFLSFKNYSKSRDSESKIAAILMNEVIKHRGPFLKVIDRESIGKVIKEQYLSMNGWVEGSGAIKTGELTGAKAILSGKVLSVDYNAQVPKLLREKAYKRRVVRKYNAETKKTESSVSYDKVFYNNYIGFNEAKVSFQYMLVSSETGEVLLSGIIEKTMRSEVDYNTYNGNANDLYPGVWKSAWKPSASDRVYTNRAQVNAFQSKFSANKNLRPLSDLQDNAERSIGLELAQKVLKFNPEK